MAATSKLEDLRWSRVQSVSDDGVVVLSFPDGQRCTVTIPPSSVSLVRRLAELDGEIDRDSQRARDARDAGDAGDAGDE